MAVRVRFPFRARIVEKNYSFSCVYAKEAVLLQRKRDEAMKRGATEALRFTHSRKRITKRSSLNVKQIIA